MKVTILGPDGVMRDFESMTEAVAFITAQRSELAGEAKTVTLEDFERPVTATEIVKANLKYVIGEAKTVTVEHFEEHKFSCDCVNCEQLNALDNELMDAKRHYQMDKNMQKHRPQKLTDADKVSISEYIDSIVALFYKYKLGKCTPKEYFTELHKAFVEHQDTFANVSPGQTEMEVR